MVVVMEERASEEQVQHVIAQLVEKGFDIHRSTGQLRSVLGAVGGNRSFDTRLIEVMDGVHEVLRITEPYKLASRTFKPERSAVSFDEFRVGGDEVIVMAGPCSVETEEQIAAAAAATDSGSARSIGMYRPPELSVVARRSNCVTRAPSRASWCATCAPIPDAHPVTTTCLPS